MINKMEQDRDWYCVVWYEDDILQESVQFDNADDCMKLLQSKREQGFENAEAYYSTEISWVMDW